MEKIIDNDKFGTELKVFIIRNFDSNKDFAKSINKSTVWVSNLITGRAKPTKAILDLMGLERVSFYRVKE